MSFQGRHANAGSFIGSWPILPSVVAGQPVLLPRTIRENATILGIQRETAAGYDLDGRSFLLNVDSTPHTISFSYASTLPLSEVISQINSGAGVTVAYNDNGFLKLQSPTAGDTSYLKIETDPSSSPTDVLLNLGLFPETEAYAGDLTQAQHVDPDRQVATPGQMAMAEGESFEARVFNRALASLAINNDRNEGQLSKKRVASRDSFDVASYSVPGAVHGIQLSGDLLAYAGRTSTPSVAELQKFFSILDSEGRELTKVLYVPDVTGVTGTFSTATDGSGKQICTSAAFNALSEATYEAGAYYLVSSAFTGGAAVLNGKPLKIVEIRGGLGASSEAAIENIDPATGDVIAITDSGIAFEVCERTATKVVVDGVFENVTTATAGTPRLENTPVAKRSSIVPTRIELGNRIVCAGEDFTASPALQVGDLVTWASSTIDSPFNNNGTYRVDKVIDPETIQVIASDWGSAILNPATTGGSIGTLTISTDGDFILNPFLRFPSTDSDALPDVGEVFEVVYLKGTTFREATDNNPAIFQSDVRFNQEADDTVARAVLRIWGPSVTSIDDVLYGDYRINLEHIDSRLNEEHYSYDDAEKTGSSADDTRSWGRHKDIRPDTINMWGYSTAETRMYLRSTADSSSATLTDPHELISVRDVNDVKKLAVTALGHITNHDSFDSTHALIDLFVDATDRYKLWGSSDSSVWTGQKLEFNFTTDPGNVGMAMNELSFVNNVPGAAVDGYDGVTLLKLNCDWSATSASKGFWGSGITFLELSGDLSGDGTDYAGYDYITALTGVHVNHQTASSTRIIGDHIGILIEDILYAGTGIPGDPAGSGNNYAIYTNAGLVRFGDRIISEVSDSLDSTTLGLGASFTLSENGATPTGSAGLTLDYDMAHTGAAAFNASAVWLRFQKSTAVNNTGLHSILRLTDGTFANESGTHAGLYVDNITGGTTDYAIYTNDGDVRFGDLVTGVEGFSAPLTSSGDVALNMLISGTPSIAFQIKRDATNPLIQWDTGDYETYVAASNQWEWYVGSVAKLKLTADELSPAVTDVLDLGSSSYLWDRFYAHGCSFSSDSSDTLAEHPWSFSHTYNDNAHTGSTGFFTVDTSVPANETSSIVGFRANHDATSGEGSIGDQIGAYFTNNWTPAGTSAVSMSVLTGLSVSLGVTGRSSSSLSSAYGIVCNVDAGLGATIATTAYGLRVGASGATTNYAVYTDGGTVRVSSDGIVVGNPGSGDMGSGTINVATNIYLNGGSQIWPDYVFEKAFTGKVEKYKSDKAALYQFMSLEELEDYAKKVWSLPNSHLKKPMGLFDQVLFAVEKIEDLYLHLFQKEREIQELKKRLDLLETN